MEDEKKISTETADTTADEQQNGNGNRAPASRFFRIVVQERISEQMDVFRWLAKDRCYETCYIRHDRDIRADSDADSDDSNDFDDDGRIKPHYHMIIRVPKKVSAKTMTKRFGGYVHFQICADPYDAAYYLTHETFRARHKYRYGRDEVKGDLDFYRELLADADSGFMADCKMWKGYIDTSQEDIVSAFSQALQNGNKRLIKSIMSHSFFFKEYFTHPGVNKKGGEFGNG